MSVASAGVGYQAMQYYDHLRMADVYALPLLAFLAAVARNGLIGRPIGHVTRHPATEMGTMASRAQPGNGSSRHFTGVPFGGVKLSGTGREESIEELLSYTQLKTVNLMLG